MLDSPNRFANTTLPQGAPATWEAITYCQILMPQSVGEKVDKQSFKGSGHVLPWCHKCPWTLVSYFSSCHEVHEAVTVSHQLALSCPVLLPSAQLDHLFSLSFRLALHFHHAAIIPLLSEHVANPILSPPSDFIADLLYACCLGNCVVSDALWPPNS